MPKLLKTLPKYRRHKATGQAIVTLMGRDHYLGSYGTAVSRAEYDRIVGEWLAAGRPANPPGEDAPEIIVVELAAAYKRHAHSYYRKNGKPTGIVT